MAVADIHIKVDPEIKAESEKILKGIGITMSDLMNMTLRRVIYERRIPFDTKLPDTAMPDELSISSIDELKKILSTRIANDDGTYRSLEQITEKLGLSRKRAAS